MIDPKIKLIAMTQPNWGIYIDMAKDALGYSPTRGLDKENIKITSEEAFLSTLDFTNDPHSNLQTPNKTFSHISFTFLAILEYDALLDLTINTNLNMSYIKANYNRLVLISGTFQEWYNNIIIGCSKNVEYMHRIIMNKIFDFFDQTGFRQCWISYEKVYLKDKTFILVRK